MPESDRTIAVRVEVLETTTGHWCRWCLLPSGVVAVVVMSYGPWAHMQTRVWCRECESGDFVTVDEG